MSGTNCQRLVIRELYGTRVGAIRLSISTSLSLRSPILSVFPTADSVAKVLYAKQRSTLIHFVCPVNITLRFIETTIKFFPGTRVVIIVGQRKHPKQNTRFYRKRSLRHYRIIFLNLIKRPLRSQRLLIYRISVSKPLNSLGGDVGTAFVN